MSQNWIQYFKRLSSLRSSMWYYFNFKTRLRLMENLPRLVSNIISLIQSVYPTHNINSMEHYHQRIEVKSVLIEEDTRIHYLINVLKLHHPFIQMTTKRIKYIFHTQIYGMALPKNSVFVWCFIPWNLWCLTKTMGIEI